MLRLGTCSSIGKKVYIPGMYKVDNRQAQQQRETLYTRVTYNVDIRQA